MILVDSIYINESGGLVLLKYLVKVLEDSDVDVFYLFDDRTFDVFRHIESNKKLFLSNSVFKRTAFYVRYKNKYTSVLCFGNIPPPIKLSVPVYVYFHQQLFLDIPKNFTLINKAIYFFKQKVLDFYKNNATAWIVQNHLMKNKFKKKYLDIYDSDIKVLPFYPPLRIESFGGIERKKNSFLYISNSSPHKNHRLLIEAFCNVFDKVSIGSLLVTIPSSSIELCQLISEKLELGYPILNVGFIDREKLTEIYLSHEYLIFPSLAESFGLGLVEAIDAGCKVIASDLPYAYEVCKPSLTFDPYSIFSIEDAILNAIDSNLPYSEKIISNDIEQLISLLMDKP